MALAILFPLHQCLLSRLSLVCLLSLLSIKTSCADSCLHITSFTDLEKLFRVYNQICLNGNSLSESKGRQAEAFLPNGRGNDLDLLYGCYLVRPVLAAIFFLFILLSQFIFSVSFTHFKMHSKVSINIYKLLFEIHLTTLSIDMN